MVAKQSSLLTSNLMIVCGELLMLSKVEPTRFSVGFSLVVLSVFMSPQENNELKNATIIKYFIASVVCVCCWSKFMYNYQINESRFILDVQYFRISALFNPVLYNYFYSCHKHNNSFILHFTIPTVSCTRFFPAG